MPTNRRVYIPVIAFTMLLLESCLYTGKAPAEFSTLLKDSTRYKGNHRLYFNGAYVSNINKTDSVFMAGPLFFFENGRVLFHYSSPRDSTSFANWLTKYTNEKWSLNKWGVYELKGDTIKAIIYIDYFARPVLHRHQLLPTYFEGILQHKEAISGWHMMPPYPHIAQYYDMNADDFKYLAKPRDLVFKASNITKLIAPGKAWINKE
jgi:hypothetical protein